MEKLAHVLLVDDDATNNFLNGLLLKQLGVTDHLVTVEDGAQALAWLRQATPAEEPDLLLLDVNMPGLNGIEFLEAYQQLPRAQRAKTVVLMLTTSMDARDLGRLEELGIAGLVSKPLTKEKVDHILQLHFQRSLPA